MTFLSLKCVPFRRLPPMLILATITLLGCQSAEVVDVEPSRPEVAPLTAKQQRIIDQLQADMQQLPAGLFTMGDSQGLGDSEELPLHQVSVSAFAISRYEVTFEQYDVHAQSIAEEPPADRWGRGRRPVIDVTWYDAVNFAQWLSDQTGINYRLPSEAEWEYAARAGSDLAYSFGNDMAELCEYANIADQSTHIGWRNKQCSDGFSTTAPVGSLKPNAFGLYDMHGNVWEWLADCWQRNYKNASADSAAWVKSNDCEDRTQRGGSWFYGADEARSAYRVAGEVFDKSVTLGFRLAHDIVVETNNKTQSE